MDGGRGWDGLGGVCLRKSVLVCYLFKGETTHASNKANDTNLNNMCAYFCFGNKCSFRLSVSLNKGFIYSWGSKSLCFLSILVYLVVTKLGSLMDPRPEDFGSERDLWRISGLGRRVLFRWFYHWIFKVFLRD